MAWISGPVRIFYETHSNNQIHSSYTQMPFPVTAVVNISNRLPHVMWVPTPISLLHPNLQLNGSVNCDFLKHIKNPKTMSTNLHFSHDNANRNSAGQVIKILVLTSGNSINQSNTCHFHTPEPMNLIRQHNFRLLSATLPPLGCFCIAQFATCYHKHHILSASAKLKPFLDTGCQLLTCPTLPAAKLIT